MIWSSLFDFWGRLHLLRKISRFDEVDPCASKSKNLFDSEEMSLLIMSSSSMRPCLNLWRDHLPLRWGVPFSWLWASWKKLHSCWGFPIMDLTENKQFWKHFLLKTSLEIYFWKAHFWKQFWKSFQSMIVICFPIMAK